MEIIAVWMRHTRDSPAYGHSGVGYRFDDCEPGVKKASDMIVLLTDFGLNDYVGVMKGVILSVFPEGKIVDLCHEIGPQSLTEAAWILKNNYRFFPEGSIFCCVVDPGVGTERRALAVKTDKYYFVAPDNGLIWETIKDLEDVVVREIPTPPDASRTFHGRDVFAGAAAEIEAGGFKKIGKKIKDVVRMEFHVEDREGMVVRIDRFGNIVTNLKQMGESEYSVTTEGQEGVMRFHGTYAEASEGIPFLIEGSCGTLEISVKNGDASELLKMRVGEKITIV